MPARRKRGAPARARSRRSAPKAPACPEGRRFQDFVEGAPDIFWEVDAEGRYTYVSPSARGLYGVAPEKMLGRRFTELLPPDDAARLQALFARWAPAKEAFRLVVHRVLGPKGSQPWVERSGKPLLDGKGRLVGYRGVDRDVTERVRVEAELRSQADRLRLLQRLEAVGRLAGGVAHEFNNALTSIGGLAQLIKESLGPGRPESADADDILAACRKAAGVVTHLLTFSRRRAGQHSRLELGALAARAAAVVRPSLAGTVELAVEAASDTPGVLGDASQLEQAVVNLLLNAADAVGGEGTVTLRAGPSVVTEALETPFGPVPAGAWARLAVSDDGAGIPAEHHARVFEPFFTTKPVGQGSGLGLAVVYGIVSQHGGHVRLRSEPGRGTEVEVYLPVCPAAEAGSGKPEKPGQTGRHPGAVLVAEDDPTLRRLVERILKRAGHEVLTAADGEAAVELFGRHKDRIGMLLLDVSMPRRQGYEVYEALAPKKAGLKVLFMSGRAETGAGDAVARLGLPLLLKPFSREALAQRVQEILDA